MDDAVSVRIAGMPSEAEPVGHLRGEVRAILELFAVHDADLHRFEGADRRVLERAVVGFGEQIEDGREDAAGQVHLGEPDGCDVDLLRHGPSISRRRAGHRG